MTRRLRVLRFAAVSVPESRLQGFKDISTGKFEEVMLIRGEEDLQAFRQQYGITGDIEKIY